MVSTRFESYLGSQTPKVVGILSGDLFFCVAHVDNRKTSDMNSSIVLNDKSEPEAAPFNCRLIGMRKQS